MNPYNLTKQEFKVYSYIKEHRGSTTRDIQRDLGIECPSARITGMRHKGVPIKEIGTKKFPGARPFVLYAIEGEPPKPPQRHYRQEMRDGVLIMVEAIEGQPPY